MCAAYWLTYKVLSSRLCEVWVLWTEANVSTDVFIFAVIVQAVVDPHYKFSMVSVAHLVDTATVAYLKVANSEASSKRQPCLCQILQGCQTVPKWHPMNSWGTRCFSFTMNFCALFLARTSPPATECSTTSWAVQGIRSLKEKRTHFSILAFMLQAHCWKCVTNTSSQVENPAESHKPAAKECKGC